MKKQNQREIIFVTLHLTDGGAERVTAELISEWARTDYKIIVVQLRPNEFSNRYDMPDGVEYIDSRLGKNRYMNMVRNIKCLVQAMRQHANAPVLCFVKKAIWVVGIASLFTRNRIVLSERNDPNSTPPKHGMVRKLVHWSFRRADACVFQTIDARDYFPEVVKKKGVIIPNPINPNLPKRYEGKREKIIVAAGRLDHQKNFAMLIRAFALLHEDFSDYQLIIYGRGALEDELKKLSEHLGVSKFVDFPGFSDNIYQDMLKCAVYVSSSDYEGISNSMLEALAMGIPSVVTDCPIGGARMIIKNGVNGILVPVGDEKAMSEGIKKILSDPFFAETLGKEAYKLRSEFPIEKIAKEWLDVLFPQNNNNNN